MSCLGWWSRLALLCGDAWKNCPRCGYQRLLQPRPFWDCSGCLVPFSVGCSSAQNDASFWEAKGIFQNTNIATFLCPFCWLRMWTLFSTLLTWESDSFNARAFVFHSKALKKPLKKILLIPERWSIGQIYSRDQNLLMENKCSIEQTWFLCLFWFFWGDVSLPWICKWISGEERS